MYKKLSIEISDERAVVVRKIIEEGSEPKMRFYTMAAISSAIATYGLMMNSTAVIIGAMLVAPLMTPIFGISLALVRGDASLLGRSIRAEIAGIVLSVAIAACFGFLISTFMFSVQPPKLITLTFVSLYAAFIGLVLYSIIALNQPYKGLTNVSVKPLEIVYSALNTNK